VGCTTAFGVPGDYNLVLLDNLLQNKELQVGAAWQECCLAGPPVLALPAVSSVVPKPGRGGWRCPRRAAGRGAAAAAAAAAEPGLVVKGVDGGAKPRTRRARNRPPCLARSPHPPLPSPDLGPLLLLAAASSIFRAPHPTPPRAQMVWTCNELNAGYAADGFARQRGVGCCVVTFCVGGLSAINAVAGAYAEDLPLLVGGWAGAASGVPAWPRWRDGCALS
jgi:hypothetical protein